MVVAALLVVAVVAALAVAGSQHAVDQVAPPASVHLPTTRPVTTQPQPQPLPGSVQFPTVNGRSDVTVCTPLGTLTATLAGEVSVIGPKQFSGVSPAVDALWVEGTAPDKSYGFELFVVSGAKSLGVNDTDIATALTRSLEPGATVLSQTTPQTIGSHTELGFVDQLGNVEDIGHVWSHAGVVVLALASYDRVDGNAPNQGDATNELATIVSSLSFPGLDGNATFPVCGRPMPV